MLYLGRDARRPHPAGQQPTENALRIVAVGRKNFMFVQSEDAGKELALLYSGDVVDGVHAESVQETTSAHAIVGGLVDAVEHVCNSSSATE